MMMIMMKMLLLLLLLIMMIMMTDSKLKFEDVMVCPPVCRDNRRLSGLQTRVRI